MRSTAWVRFFLGVVLLLAGYGLPGEAQKAPQPEQPPKSGGAPSANPERVALLRWYQANLTTTFKVRSQPYGVAFDGANIWTANFAAATVTERRASDGEYLGRFTVGRGPVGLAFDGANMWVANSADNTVSKLRAGDGKNLGTFSVGTAPWWPAFDGANVWVPNADGTVTKLRASDGKNLGTFTLGGGPIAAAVDSGAMCGSRTTTTAP